MKIHPDILLNDFFLNRKRDFSNHNIYFNKALSENKDFSSFYYSNRNFKKKSGKQYWYSKTKKKTI